uniref:Integrase, catalytic region, zinc finger, CCHC-type, peptidase aspartic, catalytic n=1 Tax=Tanacetum cinerariifolium TaxID=118510 RepID=A0A6L2N5Y1_TANCI|nr:integrase, catalytic region, zinc finger, CCHC-type, peptidase aspartic, catalytic [Tanacetum cinerariifolium]
MQSRESKAVLSKALDASLVVTECSGTKSDEHITSSSSGTHITQVVDADIEPVNDQVPSTEDNESLKKHYKDLYDSIKVRRTKTIEQTTSLIVKNDEFKAQLQEKGFKIAALKTRNSQEESYGSNDISHNHYLEEAWKKAQERNRNSKPCVMPSVNLQNTTNGMLFDSCMSKVDSEPPNGSNDDITNPYECDQTLNVSAGLAFHQQMASADNTSGPAPQRKERCTPHVAHHVLVAVIQEHVVSTSTPSSMRINQDKPFTSNPQTIKEAQSYVIPTSVEEDDHGINVAHMDNDLKSTTRAHQKWTKNHPLDKIISDPSRPISTRLHLQTEALFCYYDALLSLIEHKSYKDALTKSCWIDAMKSSMSSNIWRFGS